MTTRTADGGPTRETLRSYIGAFLLGLKDNRADLDDVRAVLDELLPPATTPAAWLDLQKLARGGMAYATSFQTSPQQTQLYAGPLAATNEIKLGLIRHWPDGMAARVEQVWLDLPGFIIDYKLYDLSRVLAEFGFVMKVYEKRPEVGNG